MLYNCQRLAASISDLDTALRYGINAALIEFIALRREILEPSETELAGVFDK